MKKKILIILSAMMIFVYPLYYAVNPPEAYAAVASKAATTAAKKIIKEVTTDIAINQAANYALQEAIDIVSDYQAKPGYKIICPDGTKTCSKPVQIKTTLTDADKSALKGQTGIELDKAITNGKGLTRWQKIMDWFVPVWLTSAAATAITYAIDPDARSLLNEVAYNALVALGFIVPIDLNQIDPVTNVKTPDAEIERNEIPANNLMTKTNTNSNFWYNQSISAVSTQNLALYTTIGNWSSTTATQNEFTHFVNNGVLIGLRSTGSRVFYVDPTIMLNPIEMTIAKNGAILATMKPTTLVSTRHEFDFTTHTDTQAISQINIKQERLRSVLTRLPYKINGFMYTDVLFNTVEGNVYHLQLKADGFVHEQMSSMGIQTRPTSGSFETKTTYIQNVPFRKQVLPPAYEEIESEQDGTINKTNYEDDQGRIALIPPAALTYEEEATGERVYRVPASTGEGFTFEKQDGTPVPEENVQVPPSWEPNITPSPTPIPNPGGNPDPYPQGTPIMTPSPTPSNPAPEPIPLTPTPTPAPNPNPETPPSNPNPPPPIETTEPVFPEGESCEEGLKFPRLSPFLSAMENNFPLSIPFDIRNAFNAAFGEIGDKKPEWTFKLRDAEFKIAPPAFFDTFKPFTDSLLRFIFSIGMIYAIMRIMKGMN